MPDTTSPISDNLGRVRRGCGLTQEQLADASGVSVDVIARLEQGRKKGARWSTLQKLATALGVPLPVLVTPPSLLGAPGNVGAGSDLAALRRAITDPGDILGLADLADDHDVTDLATLTSEVDRAWLAYQLGDYATVTSVLPTLVGDARRLHREAAASEETAAVESLLTTCYVIAAGITVMRGAQDLALTAVERAADAARRSGDALATSAAVASASWILLKQGRYNDAERVAITASTAHEPSFTTGTRAQLGAFGHLLINASCAAVRGGHADRARDHLDVARAAASRHGTDGIDRWSVFGPRVVGMYDACNAAEAGDYETAMQAAAEVPEPSGGTLPAVWEARYLLDMAHAANETRHDTQALNLVVQARKTAPDWVRLHPLAATVVLELLDRQHKASEPLAALATHLQVI